MSKVAAMIKEPEKNSSTIIQTGNCPAALSKRPLGLYLHIPFCVRKCLYCDFLSMPADETTMERYVTALCRQIRLEASVFEGRRINTIFMGGGTPSVLSGEQLTRILNTVFCSFSVDTDAEISMESNPGTLTLEKLRAYRAAGVNRLSMGLQSTENALLRSLGRIHTWEAFLENFHAARSAGFTNINIDLMSALPGQSYRDWEKTLDKVAALEPEHISAYSLIIEEGTPFYERYGEPGKTEWPPLPDEEEERQMYGLTECFLKERGYHRYEISNYAKHGCECLHNVGNWNRTEYLGLGIGAASLVEERRYRVIDNLQVYLRIMENDHAEYAPEKMYEQIWESMHEQVQVLRTEEQMEEFMFLGLRLAEGICIERFREKFGTGIETVYGSKLEWLAQQGLIRYDNSGKKIALTDRGVDVSNYVLAQFLFDEE